MKENLLITRKKMQLENILINKGDVMIGEWKNNRKNPKTQTKEKMNKKEYEKFIKNFLKVKSSSQPIVRILA